MKALIDKLASGNAVYETPDAEISENRIAACLEADDTVCGEINIKGKNGRNIKGIVISNDNHVTFENNQFNGVNNTVKYVLSSRNMAAGQILSGTIHVITTSGDYAIPFAITVKKKEIQSTVGAVTDLQEFVQLVKRSYDEAILLFLSKVFKEHFLKDDSFGYSLYMQAMKNTDRSVALEEFLVGMGLKERIVVTTDEKIHEYTNISENYGDVLKVNKSTWGYVDIDVTVEGDFLYNCKEKIKSDEFNGKLAEYSYFINASKLHGGSNHGRITLKTSNETIVYDIVIVNPKNSDKEYITNKRNKIGLVKNYLNFRIGAINSRQWLDEMSAAADARLAHDPSDVMGILVKAQVAIVENKEEQALSFLNTVSGIVAVNDASSVEEYCYYLYLKTLHKNNSTYTDEIKAEIKKYFDGGHDSWQLLWMLFYMDERYEENPSLKYTLIKRMFHNGCVSPIMYYEAASVMVKQPELLRVLNSFEIQVLNFAGKYHIETEELAKQTAEVMSKEREFNEACFHVLTRFYNDTHNKEVLSCICSMIINGNKSDREYFPWLEKGVKEELKITNLYEYYIYTINTDTYDRLERAAYKYFSYGTDTLIKNRDYFFANLLHNYEETDDMILKYRDDMEKYVTEQLMTGNNNVHLRQVYSKVLTDDFIVGDMEKNVQAVLNTYQIRVYNKNIRSVVVRHKETDWIQTVAVTDGVAYAQIYTKQPILMFMDNQGRLLAKADHELIKMSVDVPITKMGSSSMSELHDVEKIMNNPYENRGKVIELKQATEMPQLSEQFRNCLKEFIVDYYYKGYDNGDLDIYILQLKPAQLSVQARNKIIEILIERNMMEMVYPYAAKFGYKFIKKPLLEKLCIYLVNEEQYEDNALVTEMCGESFRNGCRDNNVLKYLGKHYESGSIELYQIFQAMQSKESNDNIMAERLLVQYIFEANTEDKIYDIYKEYLKGATSSNIRKAFYTYVTYNYFIKKVQCPDMVWEILEQEYADGLNTSIICQIAFMEVMSGKQQLTKRQIKICQSLMEALVKKGVNFEFYKKFNKWFKIPFDLVDKTIIDFRTNPKHKITISYEITTPEGKVSQVTEEMRSIYQGVFTKEIIMFYGETISYKITEYSDEFPQGKVVDNYFVRISEKNVYNDESRFGMINGMMICRDLQRDDVARDIMQTYELYKEAGKELFKLL